MKLWSTEYGVILPLNIESRRGRCIPFGACVLSKKCSSWLLQVHPIAAPLFFLTPTSRLILARSFCYRFFFFFFFLVRSSRAKQLTSKEHTAYRGYTETLLKWAYGCYSTKTAHRSQFMELGGLNLIDYWCFLVPSFVDRLALVHLLEIEEAQCHLPVLVKGLGTQIQMYSLLEFGSCQW